MPYDRRMDEAEAARSRRLIDEGVTILHAGWNPSVDMVADGEHGGRHSPRSTLAYANVLLAGAATVPGLDSAARIARADAAIHAVLALQETRADDAHYGNFRWMLEDEAVDDLNGVEFMLDGLVPLLRDFAHILPESTTDALRVAIALGLDEIERLDVHVSYTNIYLSDVCNSVLGGELLGDEGSYYVERGRARLDEWLALTATAGAPHEYNSPTYLAVDLARVATLAEHAADASIALRARVAEELLWLHTATHYHAELAQLAGPHSRAYFDGSTGAGGLLKLALWRLLGDDALRPATPYAFRTREEGHIDIAGYPFHLPAYIGDLLRGRSYPFESRETADAKHGNDITTYMTPHYALGTAARPYGVGEPPEQWPGPNSLLLYFRRGEAPGYGVLSTRYIINDKGGAPAATGPSHAGDDVWEEGNFVGAQHRSRAIVAYGVYARLRPAHSYKLSVRLFGVSEQTEIWIGDRRVDAFPATIEPGDPVVIAEGAAYIAIIPLEPTDMGHGAAITVNRAGHLLTLDIENYRGPSKTFWEHRSQSGPFYKGNVRNAFAIEVASTDDFASAAEFRAHVGTARIADSVDEHNERSITYASDGGSVALRYSLADMRSIERRYDGIAYEPPAVWAGAIDGSGPQVRAGVENIVEVGRMRLLAGTAPRYIVADDGARRYIVLKVTDDEAPFLLETPEAMLDCDGVGFARIEVDETASVIRIDADGMLESIRVGGGHRLIINDTDVTDEMTTVVEGVREFAGLA